LARIAADEREHQLLLAGLKASLPPPAVDRSLEASVRGFFLRLADRDVLVHFVRIVAAPAAADMTGLFRELGVGERDGRIVFDEGAPLAAIRRRITEPREHPIAQR
jgi:hypothetical protein